MKHPLLPDQPLINLGPQPSVNALPRQIRLCVWNLQKCKRPGWREDFAALCAQSDLFLAQEARLNLCAADAINQSGLNWNAAISFLSPRAKTPTGIAAGCRAPAEDVVFNATVREPLLRIPKMTMRLIYPMQGTRLLVVNMHAINFTGIAPFKRNLQNAAALLAAFEGPVIIAGDFNAWSGKRAAELLRVAKELGLKEVAFEPDRRSRYLNRAVDYIFTRGLETVSSAIPALSSSDHRPLSAVLRLP